MPTDPLPILTRHPDKDWLTRRHAARYISERGIPVSFFTLVRWGKKPGRGPVMTCFDRTVRYLRSDLDDWIVKNVKRSA